MKKYFFLFLVFIPLYSISQADLTEKVLQTWDTHCKMNYLLLDSVQESYLKDTLSSGGRTVMQDFIHINETRIMWLQQLSGTDMKSFLIQKNADRKEMSAGLKKTDSLVREFLRKNMNSVISAFKGNVVDFMGYLIAHEAHTRGQIILAFKQSGHPLPPKIQYGIWNWN